MYTFEGLLRTDSLSWAADGVASGDFLSSLEGRLSVHAIPAPGSAALIVIGTPLVFGAMRGRRRQTGRNRSC